MSSQLFQVGHKDLSHHSIDGIIIIQTESY